MRRSLVFAGLVGLACSTVERPQPSSGCESDEDCSPDEVCSLDQGGICLPQAAPPRAFLAFAIQDQSVTAELSGCDEDLIRLDPNKLLLEIDREDVVDTIALDVTDTVVDEGCTAFSGCKPEAGYECVATDLCAAPLTSKVTVQQQSRLGLPPVEIEKDYPVVDGEGLPLAEPLVLEWGHAGQQAVTPVLLDVLPNTVMGGTPERARHRRALGLDASAHEYTIDDLGVFPCNRRVTGTVRRFQGGPILAAKLTLRYDEPVATPSTILGAPAIACSKAADCPNGLVCNPDFDRCGVDLTGASAGEALSSDGGGFGAWVYSYCEDPGVAVDARAFELAVSPPEISGLPEVKAAIEAEFGLESKVEGFPPINVPPSDLELDMCVPDWPTPEDVAFDVGAKPVTLVTSDGGVDWRCCDASCLPGGALLGDDAPVPPDECTAFELPIRVRVGVPPPDPDEWEADGCLPLREDDDGHVGEFSRSVAQETCVNGSCVVSLPPDADGEDPRKFTVEITQPMTSVFRSQTLSVTIDPDTKRLSKDVDFQPRALLRGEIVCAADAESCTATEAVIVAERLRMPDESGPLGPYLYWQVAFATSETEDGTPRGARFALPVNPGVYVVTALPAPGAGGGPSRYAVIDLRSGAPGVSEGFPKLDLEDPIELEPGLTVRVRLENFDRSTGVHPYDIGSWTKQDGLTLPGSDDPIDLNDPATCYNTDSGLGCRIRSLVAPSAAGLTLLQSGAVQFTTRDVNAGKSCPQN